MYSLLGVGGHLLSCEMGEFLYSVFRYTPQWVMAEGVDSRWFMLGVLEKVSINENNIREGIVTTNGFIRASISCMVKNSLMWQAKVCPS